MLPPAPGFNGRARGTKSLWRALAGDCTPSGPARVETRPEVRSQGGVPTTSGPYITNISRQTKPPCLLHDPFARQAAGTGRLTPRPRAKHVLRDMAKVYGSQQKARHCCQQKAGKKGVGHYRVGSRLQELAGLIGPGKVKKNPLATVLHTITSSMAFIV
jgi:hypothetical protein